MRARALLGAMGNRKRPQGRGGETTSGSPPLTPVASRTTAGAAVAPVAEKLLADGDETHAVDDMVDLIGQGRRGGDEGARSNGGYKGTPEEFHATDLKEAYSAEGTGMVDWGKGPGGDEAVGWGGEGMGTESAAAPSGVVIRVFISGAHASFLHMRVFPSTTAGQVCRKIGEKLRQPPSERSEHVLIAIYARPFGDTGLDRDRDRIGGDGEGDGGAHSDDEVGALGRARGLEDDRLMATESFHGGQVERREMRRRRGGLRGQGSVRHILHTFRPEERLGELRLGLSSSESDLVPALAHAPQSVDEGSGPKSALDREVSRDGRIDMEAGEAQGEHDRISHRTKDSGMGAGKGVVSSGWGAEGGGIRRALMWRSRWIYRDKRAPPLEADELQVEVSGSETSDDEARAGWVDLWGLGQGHYCGYLLKKSRKDLSLWRRRWCILADDRLWMLRSKSDQCGGRVRRNSHSYSLSLVPCVVRAVSRSAAPSHCFELHAQSRVHLFRAESRAKQVAWVSILQRQARQAAEDSYISVAEHMMCDEEFARSRRLNEIISSALGGKACAALEDVALRSSAASPQPSLISSLPTTSGLFRRNSIGRISPSSSPPKGVSKDSKGLVGEGTGDGCPLVGDEAVVLGAVEVRRGLRFCMKAHRFREMCRPGSCVAIRKRWAYAADALEELCPGASDRNHWATANAVSPPVGEGTVRVSNNSSSDTFSQKSAFPAPVAALATPAAEDSVVGSVEGCASSHSPPKTPPSSEADIATGETLVGTPGAANALPMAVVAVPDVQMVIPNLPKPLLPASSENILAVARELQNFRDSIASARARAESVGRGGQGGGAMGASLNSSSPSPQLPPAAPPESLLDGLLEEVLRVLGEDP